MLGIGMVVPFLALAGVALLIHRDPSGRDYLDSLSGRRLLRLVAPLIPMVILGIVALLTRSPAPAELFRIAWIIAPTIVLFLCLERIMRRVPNAPLAVRSRWIAYWSAAFGLLCAGVTASDLFADIPNWEGPAIAIKVIAIGCGIALAVRAVQLLLSIRQTLLRTEREAARNATMVQDFANELQL